jgi:hypothetical protein
MKIGFFSSINIYKLASVLFAKLLRILKNSLKYRLMFQESIKRLFSDSDIATYQRPIYINRWKKGEFWLKVVNFLLFSKNSKHYGILNFLWKISSFLKSRSFLWFFLSRDSEIFKLAKNYFLPYFLPLWAKDISLEAVNLLSKSTKNYHYGPISQNSHLTDSNKK